MHPQEVLQTVQQHGSTLAHFGVRSLALFGSVARGEATDRSDVDFVVEFEEPVTFARYAGLASFLEDVLERRVDLLTRASLRPAMLAAIEGDLLYAAGPATIRR
jgi:predicted nucleotidyltransferase